MVGISGVGAQRPASRARARSPAGPGASPSLRQSQASAFSFQSPNTRTAPAAQQGQREYGSGLFMSGAATGGAATGSAVRSSQAGVTRTRDSRLSVVVRKRPMNRREIQAAQQDVVLCRNSAIIVREPKLKVDLTRYVEEHNFLFDQSFDENVANEQLYEACVRPVIDAVFQGAKCTCFAYGQTGSGKTFTMMGPHKRQIEGVADCDRTPGIFLLAARDLFRGLTNREFGHLGVHVAFYEIYCGKLFDLLNNRQILHARENAKANVVIVGLQELAVQNSQELMEVIDLGLSSRTTGVTGANIDSSRSHAILQISLKDERQRDAEGKLKEHGKISFIDLAGSERGADTMDTDRQTRMDGAEINKSLLALKECIRALDQQQDHTPFRGSKLTQVLKDSFVGSNCRTVMIANVSPCGCAVEHSLNTLRYAYRVKELRGAKPGGAPGPSAGSDAVAAGGSLTSGIDDPGGGSAAGPPPLPLGGAGFVPGGHEAGLDVEEPFRDALDDDPCSDGGLVASELRSPRAVGTAGSGGFPATVGPPAAASAVAAAAAASVGGAAYYAHQVQPQQQQHLQQQQPLHPHLAQQVQAVPQMSQQPQQAWGAPEDAAQMQQIRAYAEQGGLQHRQELPPEVTLEPGASGSQAALDELARQHDRLIGTILAEEEELITAHRQHIDMMVELIKEEMLHLNNVDRPGSDVDAYVTGLDKILMLKSQYIGNIRQRVDTFKEHLQQEDSLSKKFQTLASSSTAR